MVLLQAIIPPLGGSVSRYHSHMVGMRDVVEAIRAADLGDVKVIIGGAPVTAEFAVSIGADGYAPDAASAVKVATRLVGTDPTG